MKVTQITTLAVVACFLAVSAISANEPPAINDGSIPLTTPDVVLMHTFTLSQGDEPITWGNFTFVGYTPNYGGSGSGPIHPATFDVDLHKFIWDTSDSPRGDYEWRVTATNPWGSDEGRMQVAINYIVPEPCTLSLVGIAMMGLLGRPRRRT